jgi:tetratricopeptide (TPR) repeat protein
MVASREPVVTGGSVEQGLANGWDMLEDHPEQALRQAETLLKLGPDPRALRLAAAAHRKLGDPKKAQAAELVAVEASLNNPRLRAAAEAQQSRRSEEASAIAAAFLQEQPGDLLALAISAETAIDARRLDRAEEMLRHALGRAPQFVQAAVSLARCLILQSRLKDAIAEIEEVLRHKPNNFVALRLYARLLSDTRDHEGAAAIYERLITMDDREIDLWINYASTLRFIGRRQDAELALRRALSMDEGHGGAWWGLVDLAPEIITDGDIETMRKALAERRDRPQEAASLAFALGIVLDRRGEHAAAFEHLAEGNALHLQFQPYNPDDVSREVDSAIATFAAPYFARHKGEGVRDASPIFIVGMPRSGSTMVERILGRHSRIEAAGELPIIPRLTEQLGQQPGGFGRYHQKLASIGADEVREMGEQFLQRSLAFRRTEKTRFTDKLHMNWRHLGLIHLILPNARIIDVRRNPIDCCWSNFKLQFATGHPAASDLAHIGRFYRDYVRHMEHFRTIAPDRILEIRYEDVVDDIDGQMRAVFAFLGLEFEPQSLDFHLSAEPVATASSEQVRRPLNREGLGAWRPYRQWLGPLVEALGPLADAELAEAERA